MAKGWIVSVLLGVLAVCCSLSEAVMLWRKNFCLVRYRITLALSVAAGLASSPVLAGDVALTASPPGCFSVAQETCATAQKLGRGINFGNMLEAPREGDWGVRVEPAYLDLAAGHFKTVRLPVRWTNHAALTADARLEEVFANRVDAVVDQLLARGLYVILDLHHYSQLFGDGLHPNEAKVAPEVLEERLVNIWRQLAERYRNRSPRLLFELLNEPHGKLDSEAWNGLLARLLSVVRQSNPNRIVLAGPTYWNGVRDLDKLRLPPDRNLIVAFHNYDPFPFTHQGITYLPKPFPTGTTCCDAAQRKQVVDALDKAKRWSEATGYPLHLGEFGAYQAADMASRENYTRFVRDEAEKRGFGWTYWELASSFGVYDAKAGRWVEPIRRALLD